MQLLCCVALGTHAWVSYPHDGPSGPLEPSGSFPEHPVIWGLVCNRDPAGLLVVRHRRQMGGDGQPLPGQVQGSRRERRTRVWTLELHVWAQAPALPHTRAGTCNVILSQFFAFVREDKSGSYLAYVPQHALLFTKGPAGTESSQRLSL